MMVRHNNMIPDGHFHKKWQRHVKTWFDQPMRKYRRHNRRDKKLVESAPCPVDKLRPVVHCPSVRYNKKIRKGRGFSLAELKAAGINPKFARTIGISVDSRRRNKSHETLSRNVQILKAYQVKLVVFPKKKWEEKFRALNTVVALKNDEVKQCVGKLNVRVPTDKEKKFEAKVTLRKARADAKFFGRRQKLKKLKEAGIQVVKGGKKMKKVEADE